MLGNPKMREADSERAVLIEWSNWAPRNCPNRPQLERADALMFFAYLQTEKPQLLSFQSSRDKWTVVHGWLLSRGLVAN